MAEAAAFTKHNGLSGLDNAKAANLYQVLTWASEKKDMEDLIAQQYEK